MALRSAWGSLGSKHPLHSGGDYDYSAIILAFLLHSFGDEQIPRSVVLLVLGRSGGGGRESVRWGRGGGKERECVCVVVFVVVVVVVVRVSRGPCHVLMHVRACVRARLGYAGR